MTITSTQNRITYAGNGAPGVPGVTAFSVPFRFLAPGDLVVLVRDNATGVDTTKTLDTHYSVAGEGAAAGGTVTFLIEDGEPQTGETLIIYGNPALTQTVDYISGGVFPAETHEQAMDLLTLQQARTRELVERTPGLVEGDTDGSGAYDANLNRIKNLAVPTADADAASKNYVDSTVTNTVGPIPSGGTYVTATGSTTARTIADRWGEAFNVKDFGAVGDGVTDDSDAIQAALDAWREAPTVTHPNRTGAASLLFPPGEYLCNDNLSVTFTEVNIGNKDISGYGATLRSAVTSGDFLFFKCEALVRNISVRGLLLKSVNQAEDSLLRVDGGTTTPGPYGLPFFYQCSFTDVTLEDFGADGWKCQNAFFENNFYDCSARSSVATGDGFLFEEPDYSGMSSINLFGTNTSGCEHGVYVKNPLSDLNIIGGTFLQAQKNGILYENGQGCLVSNVHVENNWEGAADLASGGAGVQINGWGSAMNIRGTSNSKQLTTVGFYVSEGRVSDAQGIFAGVNTQYEIAVAGAGPNYGTVNYSGSGEIKYITPQVNVNRSGANGLQLGSDPENHLGKIYSKSDGVGFDQTMYRWTGVGDSYYAYRLSPQAAATLDLQTSSLKDIGSEVWTTVYTVDTSGAIGFTNPTPIADSTNDLGTSAKRWRSIFTDSIVSTISTLADEATPTVAGGSIFVTSGTANDPITDFDNGTVGQTITILAEHAITITDGTNIILHGSANFVMAASDSLTLVLKADNKWYETARMVN